MSLPADFIVWAASPEADFLKGKFVFANWDVEELKVKKDQLIKENLLEIWLVGNPRFDPAALKDFLQTGKEKK